MTSARQIYLGSRRGPALPYDSEVEYLKSTGTQYIDLGLFPQVITAVELDCQFNQLGKCLMLGSYNGYDSGANMVVGTNENLNYFWTQWGLSYGGSCLKDTQRHLHRFERDGNLRFTYTVDGGYLYTGANVSTQPTNNQYSCFLFACNNMGTLYRQSVASLYSCKVSDGDSVVRDLVPVRFTNAQGVSEGAMYDRVSGQLFRNVGTGAFVFGTDIAVGGGYKCLGYSPLRFSRFSRLWKEAA